MEPGKIHIEVRGIRKTFGGVQALRDVSLGIRRGEVHALVGENGAGKSTLGRIIAGEVLPSAGEIRLEGAPVDFRTPRQALAHGIAIVDQELTMLPADTVQDNIFLGTQPSRLGLLQRRAQRQRCRELIEESGFLLDPDAVVGTLRTGEQQKVEILRALARNAELIVMDEPTARLSSAESEQLYRLIELLRQRGTTIVFISHFLREVLQLADSVTVMRGGRVIRTKPAADETVDSLVLGMVGHTVELGGRERRPGGEDGSAATPVLSVEGLTSAGQFADVSFDLRPGEILGFAGLVGSGRTEVARAIIGCERPDSGTIRIDGDAVKVRSPKGAIKRGVVMLAESRKDEGLVMCLSVSENLTLSTLASSSRYGLRRPKAEREDVERMISMLDIKASDPTAPVSTLSGGNQQKVLLGKLLLTTPRVLIADEPTRGVDVGAKQAIYDLLVELAASGVGIVLISSELEEVIGLSHRILVMSLGEITGEFAREEIDEQRLLNAAFANHSGA